MLCGAAEMANNATTPTAMIIFQWRSITQLTPLFDIPSPKSVALSGHCLFV
jgi:hypothetical protein